MSNFNSAEFQLAYVNKPSSQLEVSKQHGRKRIAYASYTLLAELSINETISMLKLPAGARICNARIIAPSDGTTGQLDVGWLDNGVDGADADGLFDGLSEADTGGGAVDSKLAGVSPGYMKKFAEEVTIEISALEATTASSGDKIQLEIEYVID